MKKEVDEKKEINNSSVMDMNFVSDIKHIVTSAREYSFRAANLMQDYKVRMRELLGRQYSHELLNNLFNHPYTKIEFIVQDLNVSRLTATKYLNRLVDAGLLDKVKMKNSNYYLNLSLTTLLVDHSEYYDPKGFDAIESINRML